MKTLSRYLAVALSLAACRADVSEIETIYLSILSQRSGEHIATPLDLAGPVTGNSVLRDASKEQVESLAGLGRRCLESPNPVVRSDGMLLLSTIAAVRPDNADLLSPYFEIVASFLRDPEVGMKQAAILTLASGYPQPASRATQLLASHLNDRQNTGDQFLMISGALLSASPSDATVVRSVLAALAERTDREMLKDSTIQEFGNLSIVTEESIEFIRLGFADKRSEIRRVAVEAVGKMPRDVITRLAGELRQVLANPDESPETVFRAREALAK